MDLRLFRNNAFLSLWATTLISMLSIAIAWVAESWYAINVLHREKEYGYILLCGMIPRIVFMLVGGAVADNFSKRNVVASSLVMRAVLLLVLGALIVGGFASFPIILLTAFLYGVIDAYYWPSRDAILVEIVPRDDLPRANSIMLTTGQVGWIFGPALGGMLIGYFALGDVIIALGAILLLASAMFLALLKGYAPAPATALNDRSKSKRERAAIFLSEMRTGLSYVRNHPQFSVLMLLFAVANILFMGPLQQSVPLIAKELSGDASAFGGMWSSWGAGMAGGGILMSVLAPKRKRFLLVACMVLMESVFLVALALTRSMVVVCVVMFVIGFCIACNNVPTTSMLQIYADKDKVGRVMGFNDTISMGLTPLSYVGVSALLALGTGHHVILIASGAAMFVFCAYMMIRYPVIRTTD